MFNRIFPKKESNSTSPSPEGQSSTKKYKELSTSKDLSRRNFLKFMGATGISAALNEACTESYLFRFSQNFNYYSHPQFTEEDLREANERNKQKITAENCRVGLQKAMNSLFPLNINPDDLITFKETDGVISATTQLKSEEGRKTLMAKYPFIARIIIIASPYYEHNYELRTDTGYLHFSLNNIEFSMHDENNAIQMKYDLHSPLVQTSPAVRDYQRTILTTKYHRDLSMDLYELFLEGNGGMLEHLTSAIQSYTPNNKTPFNINETQSLIKFLQHCQATPLIKNFFANVEDDNKREAAIKGKYPPPKDSTFSLTNIENIDQLIEIFRLMPADPEEYGALIRRALRYQINDKSIEDEYRDPITTLRSGWADCDDFAVLHYFWGHLHNHNPNMTAIKNTRTQAAHVFVWYRDQENRLIIMDNGNCVVFDKDTTVESYLSDFSSDYIDSKPGDKWEILHNGPV
jgi:hypothetical protein